VRHIHSRDIINVYGWVMGGVVIFDKLKPYYQKIDSHVLE
jgi:hypothetical protein